MLTDPQEDYARGFVPFLGQNIFLDSRPLIPRTETEYWVEKAIAEIKESNEKNTPTNSRGRVNLSVLDLFSGSGCIGIAIMAHIPNAHVTFADIEPRHFPTIKKSLSEILMSDIKISERATFVETDAWRRVTGQYDYVFANPPYISKERETAARSVIREEPKEALFADDDGFALIKKTLQGLGEHLAPKGIAWIEHEPYHTPRLEREAAAGGLSLQTYPDQYGVLRFSRLAHL